MFIALLFNTYLNHKTPSKALKHLVFFCIQGLSTTGDAENMEKM